MKQILVIGNGFDLYHNRKTRYSDFLKFLNDLFLGKYDKKKSICAAVNDIFKDVIDYRESSLLNYCLKQFSYNSENDKWIDLEKDIKDYIKTIIDFVTFINSSSNDEIVRKRKYLIKSGIRVTSLDTKYALLIDNSKSLFKANDNKMIIDSHFVTVWGSIDLRAILVQIEKELSCLSHLLELYLSEIEPTIREDDYCQKELFSRFDYDVVISFNYTNTVSELYHPKDVEYCFPHGKTISNNTVLGYNDENQELQDLAFKKYYRRLINSTDSFDINEFKEPRKIPGMVGFIDEMPVITFFGHSMDISDEDLLTVLLSNTIKRINIFYLDEIDRSEKIANIIKIIGKQEAIERIDSNEICFILIPQ